MRVGARSNGRGRSTRNAATPSLRWIWPKQRTRKSFDSSSADHVATHTCLPRAFTASTAGAQSYAPETRTAASEAVLGAEGVVRATHGGPLAVVDRGM